MKVRETGGDELRWQSSLRIVPGQLVKRPSAFRVGSSNVTVCPELPGLLWYTQVTVSPTVTST